MKKSIEVPDMEIKLSRGDKVCITARKAEIVFDFFCDGTGNSFILRKEELKRLMDGK